LELKLELTREEMQRVRGHPALGNLAAWIGEKSVRAKFHPAISREKSAPDKSNRGQAAARRSGAPEEKRADEFADDDGRHL
jgi:hypothetical protein